MNRRAFIATASMLPVASVAAIEENANHRLYIEGQTFPPDFVIDATGYRKIAIMNCTAEGVLTIKKDGGAWLLIANCTLHVGGIRVVDV